MFMYSNCKFPLMQGFMAILSLQTARLVWTVIVQCNGPSSVANQLGEPMVAIVLHSKVERIPVEH